MKYSNQEQLNEILSRSKKLTERKEHRIMQSLYVTATALTFVLMLCIGAFTGKHSMNKTSSYGSFLLSEEAGGYILVAIIAFVVGIIVATLIYKQRKGKTS